VGMAILAVRLSRPTVEYCDGREANEKQAPHDASGDPHGT
jgi:hypothetical protein